MSEPQTYAYDTFISCSPQDRAWVEGILLPRLQSAGLQVRVSSPLQRYEPEGRRAIAESINSAQYVIAILSPAALANQQTQLEWEAALERDFLMGTFSLLPVKIAALDNSQLPKQIAALSAVDVTRPDKLEMALAYLLSVWKQ
jgi:hypothetical protein